MSDQNAETERPPAPGSAESIHETMRELQAALANVGTLCGRLSSQLTLTQLAVLTGEHRMNVLTEHDKDHELRLKRLEGLLTDPPAAEATAAE